jgi:hypothetical protein
VVVKVLQLGLPVKAVDTPHYLLETHNKITRYLLLEAEVLAV